MAETATVKRPMSKSDLLTSIAEKTGLTRKQVSQVLGELGNTIQVQLSKKGPGVFALLIKVRVVKKPAVKGG